jgi:hypothetical protein
MKYVLLLKAKIRRFDIEIFHQIEGEIAKTNFVTEYLNDDDRKCFVKNLVAGIYYC